MLEIFGTFLKLLEVLEGIDMEGSGTIRVLKRDQSVELFDARKLSVAFWRPIAPTSGGYGDALKLAEAVGIYLSRNDWQCVSSAALFEMALKVLRQAGLAEAADAMEAHHRWRSAARVMLKVRHEDGRATNWDKSYLSGLAMRLWHLRLSTARILAGEIECRLLVTGDKIVAKADVVAMLNELVSQLGLAEAVPVEPIAV